VLGAIWRRHRLRLLAALVLQACYSGVQFVGPLMLNQIVQFLTRSDLEEAGTPGVEVTSQQLTDAYLYALGMFLAPVVGTLIATQGNRLSVGTQVMIRAEVTAAIYRKALRLSAAAKQAAETGRVVNLMSADVNQIQSFFYPFAAQLVTGPAMLITSLVLLWFRIKWATFIGLGILLVSTPATTIFLKKITQYRRSMLRETDGRVKLMNQLLVGIRVLKMYAWEAAQEAAVLEARRRELRELGKAIPHRVALQTLLFAAPTLAMVASFAVYGSVEPAAFTPANIFTAISLFALMRFPLIFLPFALIQLANALVSMRRLSAFFLLEDRKDYVEALPAPGILVEGGEFFWAEPPPEAAKPEKKGKKGGAKKGGAKKGGAEGKGGKGGKGGAEGKGGKGGASPASSAAPTPRGTEDGEKVPENAAAAAGAPDGVPAGGVAVALPGGAAARAPGSPAWTLSGVDLAVGPGELVAVVGRVGAGKSSLVSALLGEMERASGRVAVGGALAYAAQQAWIVNATLRDNVTFGAPYDEARWTAAVEACALAADLAVLPAGAETEIGEKGINLSGGQKARVSLARALYRDADVYILDDPLSAVDVHVGRHIFEKFIDGAIKDKARLLVTNQIQYAAAAHRVVVVDAGRVVAVGTYDECLSNDVFARLVAEHSSAGDAAGAAEAAADERTRRGSVDAPAAPALSKSASAVAARGASDALASVPGALGAPGVAAARLARGETFARGAPPSGPFPPVPNGAAADGQYGKQLARMETMAAANRGRPPVWASKLGGGGSAKKAAKKSGGKKGGRKGGDVEGGDADAPAKGALMVKEDREEGQVTGAVYGRYIRMYGLLSFLALVFLWSSEQSVRILTNWWLSQWTQAEIAAAVPGAAPVARMEYVGGYLGFALGFVLLTCVRSLCNLLSALRASRLIHERTLAAVVRAPVAFFDTTPVGRVLNRFSKDTDEVDFLLSMSMTEFGNCIMQLTATLIFLAVVQPIILAGVGPLMVIYWLLQRFYRKSYIELQRLDAVSRSPIYAHFSESLAGVDTIRAYRLAGAFARTSDARVDANHRAYFSARMANEWLAMRLDLVGACIVFLVAVLAIARRDIITASLAALTLSEALDVTLFLKSAVTSGAMFESRFNSVERLTSYWGLPQEAPAASAPGAAPPAEWPTRGAISYRGVWMRYRPELDPVLRGVSFDVAPGDKVGIVGRTGSGKSSLIVTLFRLVEPFAGAIELDGIDLLTLGLDDVRGRIAAIPQDPVLFSGSVRTNLDPYGRHADGELWDALGHVALKAVVAALPEGLGARVAEGGDNFSVGQRQLLCVARALLRRPRVLVADEATASVDAETDALIQRTIRREFADCTVLTIAHRINTILDSTRVLVMEDGVVGEYDTVPVLMGRSTSSFRAMVVESGLEAGSMSRGASAANLAAEGGEGGGGGARRLEGRDTFVRRIAKNVGLKD
jgi:ABC-type multidrug transport system fused ATPase/permease subunit